MTYIWNRAERVPEELKPETITTSFQKWSKEQYKKFKLVTDKKKQHNILLSIKKQTENYQDAVARYK
tara:strand:- start:2401 stop:2601 length:201 start_codon:yes stop_codon:yes gene_type:complete